MIGPSTGRLTAVKATTTWDQMVQAELWAWLWGSWGLCSILVDLVVLFFGMWPVFAAFGVFGGFCDFCGIWGSGQIALDFQVFNASLGCHSFFAVRMVSCAADSRPMNWLVNLVSFATAPQTRALMLIHTQVAKA